MNIRRPPRIDINFADLPNDPRERHEVLVDVFGRYIFWLRNWSVDITQELIESKEAREGQRTIGREKYESLSALTPEQREMVCEVSQATVDRFSSFFLWMLAGEGVDQRLGNGHAIRFKLDLEICDVESGNVIDQETINRGGKKFFGNYWGRWLNQSWGKRQP